MARRGAPRPRNPEEVGDVAQRKLWRPQPPVGPLWGVSEQEVPRHPCGREVTLGLVVQKPRGRPGTRTGVLALVSRVEPRACVPRLAGWSVLRPEEPADGEVPSHHVRHRPGAPARRSCQPSPHKRRRAGPGLADGLLRVPLAAGVRDSGACVSTRVEPRQGELLRLDTDLAPVAGDVDRRGWAKGEGRGGGSEGCLGG